VTTNCPLFHHFALEQGRTGKERKCGLVIKANAQRCRRHFVMPSIVTRKVAAIAVSAPLRGCRESGALATPALLLPAATGGASGEPRFELFAGLDQALHRIHGFVELRALFPW